MFYLFADVSVSLDHSLLKRVPIFYFQHSIVNYHGSWNKVKF